MPNYVKLAAGTKVKIIKNGRPIVLYKRDATAANPAKPWRGPDAPVNVGVVNAHGVFVVPNTSIPTESRGLGFDWVDQDLLKRVRRVCLVYADGLPDLENYNILVDDGKEFVLTWGQCLKPGSVRLLYVFGMAQ